MYACVWVCCETQYANTVDLHHVRGEIHPEKTFFLLKLWLQVASSLSNFSRIRAALHISTSPHATVQEETQTTSLVCSPPQRATSRCFFTFSSHCISTQRRLNLCLIQNFNLPTRRNHRARPSRANTFAKVPFVPVVSPRIRIFWQVRRRRDSNMHCVCQHRSIHWRARPARYMSSLSLTVWSQGRSDRAQL